MNMIDRSPLKTSTREALVSQSVRLMNEAKTAEEKASVVQDFAEKLRLEKLRAKRFQENMRQLGQVITLNSAGASSTNVGTPNSPIQPMASLGGIQSSMINELKVNPKLGNSNFVQPLQHGQRQQGIGGMTNWIGPYQTSLDIESGCSGSGEAHGGPSHLHVRNLKEPVVNPTAGKDWATRYSSDGVSLTQLMNQKPAPILKPVMIAAPITKPVSTDSLLSSRPLNVHAPPFEMKPKISSTTPIYPAQLAFPTDRQASIPTNAPTPITVRTPVVAAVAPKAVNMTAQPNTIQLDNRPRSASIGMQRKAFLDQNRIQQLAKPTDEAANEKLNYQKGITNMSTPMDDGQPRWSANTAPGFKGRDMETNVRTFGRVVENTASGGKPSLSNEDWDSEYVNEKESNEKKRYDNLPVINKANHNRKESPPGESTQKDWLSVLKERDDMANKRYSKETMLRLTLLEASQKRPSYLSPEYNNPNGIWSPDLWFHINFQSDRPATPAQKDKANIGNGRNAVSVDQVEKVDRCNLRRISMLSEYAQMQGLDKNERCSSR